jgi:hypothetical protein
MPSHAVRWPRLRVQAVLKPTVRQLSALVGVLTAFAAPAAEAASLHTAVPGPGPLLSGPTAVWVVSGKSGPRVVAADPRRDSRPHLALQLRVEDPGPQLSTSSTRIAASDGNELVAGPAAGPFEPVTSCLAVTEFHGFDLDGDLLAGPDCSNDKIQVRDLAGGTQEPVPGSPRGVHIAGRYVTWIQASPAAWSWVGQIFVWDRSTRSIAYSIPQSAMPHGFRDLDVRADGTIVIAYFTKDFPSMRVAWASATEPRLHTLPLPTRASYEVRIAGDRIAFARGNDPFGLGGVSLAEVGVTDFSGRTRILTRGAESAVFGQHFDFDGTRIAYYKLGCTDAIVEVRHADARPLSERVRRGCRLRFDRAAKPSGSDHVRVFVDCFGFADHECGVKNLVLTVDGRVVARARRGQRAKLTPRGRRLMAAHRTLHLHARATLTDLAGRREPRRGATVVKR